MQDLTELVPGIFYPNHYRYCPIVGALRSFYHGVSYLQFPGGRKIGENLRNKENLWNKNVVYLNTEFLLIVTE